ncbi:MAG: MFS transporter [Nitrososphaerota archaeon]|jgi:EmrB/QacA subfamily drug resistance transporter|nr:MFS transporter [Nitrososphaerota archaeon]MDG6976414.1 MFS transporter [Nitrososphaerota archaeon]MDG7014525.1 MFS transporter [Nitrososphaerota archaeon]WGO50505.1 MAG: MFS transporter [Nitrososphaerota archaeon]
MGQPYPNLVWKALKLAIPYKYVVLINTTIGAFMAILDSNIVLIALPTITHDLHASPFEAVWIIMGYVLVTASLLMTFGRLSDIFGRVKLYILGFALFTIGSALCSIAPNGLSLVAFRLVQGAGGALIFSNAAALLTDAFPATERGRALGLNQVAGTVGSVLGLALGGILAGSFLGWRSIFWINIPFGTFATVWAYFKLKELSEPRRGEKLDSLGNVLFSGGLTIFLVGLMLGALIGWAPLYLGVMAIGVAMVGSFVFVETRVKYPLMDLSLFRIKAFATGMASNLLASIARGGVSLVLVFYFQGVLLLDAFTAGLWLIPFSVAFVTFGPLSGYLSDKVGSRGLATAGLLVTSLALFWFGIFPLGTSSDYLELLVPMVLAGAGGGLFVAPNVASIMNATPAPRRGIASGMNSTIVNAGFLLSLGLAFAVMAASVPTTVLQEIFAGTASSICPTIGPCAILERFVGSLHGLFLIMGFISLFAAVPAYMTKKQKAEYKAGPAAGID